MMIIMGNNQIGLVEKLNYIIKSFDKSPISAPEQIDFFSVIL